MHEITQRTAALLCSAVCGLSMLTPAAAGLPIAGVHPDQRLPGAPRVTAVKKDGAWYTQALTGVSRPYPYSLRFLEDQGNWYTPFNLPGMTPPYDLRGWYAP